MDKSNLCITLIEYDMLQKDLDVLESSEKNKILVDIDEANQNVKNYFRLTHKILATSSDENLCKNNTKIIINNLVNLKKEGKLLINDIGEGEEININGILNLIFIIFIISLFKLFQHLIKLFQSKMVFKKN